MIVGFPTVYSDELLYSWLARYYVQSGYTSYIFAARDLFKHETSKPSLEFMTEPTTEALELITRDKSLENVIRDHTMFPQYARFLPTSRRNKALQLLVQMDKEFNNFLYWKKGGGTQRRWMKYCPECAKTDRRQIGETFWRREHQLIGVEVCARHGCRLVESSIEMCSRPSPSLICAECEVPAELEADYNVTGLELRVAQYVTDVFRGELDMQNQILASEFLHSKMEYTKYLTERGTHRRTSIIFEDFSRFCSELSNNPIKEVWQMSKIFRNQNLNHYDICLLAMFLGVKPDELVHMQLPQVRQCEVFDDRVRELHAQGLNYRQVATVMGTSYDVVKLVARGKYINQKKGSGLRDEG